MNKSFRKFYVILYWVLITLIVLYDRRFLTQKAGLGHFIECTVVRVGLLMALAYLNIYFLIPRLLDKEKVIAYIVAIVSAVGFYLLLQQAYDVYLYGFVLGDEDSKTLQAASLYLIATTIWYLVLTIVFHRALEWYEQKKQLEILELEVRQMKEREAVLVKEENSSEMFIKSGTKQVKIDINDVLYLQGLKDYAVLFTSREKLIVKGSLKTIEDMFPPGMLVRVHKSYVVAQQKITSVSASKLSVSGKEIPIGRSFRENVNEILKKAALKTIGN
ncbi:MAG: LytTR family transcriptional regulator DNA-binding domain-containing protein [Cyclobacteriaceae bacterium]|nr:LytTR family transcriptional regulator DNA-binding domain-containing protein [Cyclobacteriaceae bacterium]